MARPSASVGVVSRADDWRRGEGVKFRRYCGFLTLEKGACRGPAGAVLQASVWERRVPLGARVWHASEAGADDDLYCAGLQRGPVV